MPDRLLLIGLALFLSVSLSVTANLFVPWVVAPLFAVLLAVLWRFLPEPTAATRGAVRATWAALVVAVVFVAGNVAFVSQWFQETRDPGVYQLFGLWLSKSPSPDMDITPAFTLIRGLTGFSVKLGTFAPSSSGLLHAQGGDLLPGLIGVMTWIGGVRGGLVTNLLLGALALVAVYALARRIVGPVWALVPQVALGLSVAFLFLARGPYSEMIMVTVGVAGLIWLLSALRRGRTSDFVVSGLFLGVASMARIDGLLAVVGVVIVFGVAAFGFVSRERRVAFWRGAALLVLTAGVVTVAGFVDLVVHKGTYLHAQWLQTRSLILATIAIVVLVAVLALLLGRRGGSVGTRATRATAVALASVTAALLVFWVSRPLWFVSRFNAGEPSDVIEDLQSAAGLPVDGTRTYDEQTMSWIALYFGWPLVVLAMAGLVLLVYRGWSRKTLEPFVIVAPALAAALLYFTRVSITPDQVWAYRRLLPFITPGFLIAASFVLAETWRLAPGRLRARVPHRPRYLPMLRVGLALVALVVTFGALPTYNSLLLVRDGGNQYTESQRICAAITSDTVLVVSDGAPAYHELTVKAACHVDVVVSAPSSALTPAALATLAERAPGMNVVLSSLDTLPGARSLAGSPTAQVVVTGWPRSLVGLPTTPTQDARTTYVGRLARDGTVKPAR